jgi:phosphate transporter
LEKICSFYQLKELEIYGELDSVLRDEAEYEVEQHTLEDQVDEHGPPPPSRRSGRERSGSIFRSFNFGKRRRASTLSNSRGEDDEDSDEEDVRVPLTKAKSLDTRASHEGDHDDYRSDFQSSKRKTTSIAFEDYNDMSFSVLYDSGITLKKRIISAYVSLCELRSFIQLNQTGFRKVLKKYDKILDRDLKSSYLKDHVEPAYPFQRSTIEHLNQNIDKMEQVYAQVVTQGKMDEAKRELRLHLREHVVWERNTVWREMIGIERKAQAANLGIRNTMLGRDTDPSKARLQGDQDEIPTKEVQTPIGTYRCPSWLISSTFWTLVVIIAIFIVMLYIPIMEQPEQQNCLAMVIFVSLLWATEAIPLFVTSLLVPFLVVLLQVVRSAEKPHRRLEPKAAASFVFAAMWAPVIMLLLGGFTIAAALSKYNIAKMMATFVLSKAGTKPRNVLVATMFVAMFASMWISNVAAPVLCYSIIQVRSHRSCPPANVKS